MKKRIAILSLLIVCFPSFADWRAGISGAANAAAEIYRQEALMEREHELEMKRMQRQFELREQMQIRAEQQEQRQRDAQRSAQRAAPKADREAAFSQVEAVHPDWRAIANSEKFAQWRKRQPRSVDALGESERPADAILMIDLYKRDQK